MTSPTSPRRGMPTWAWITLVAVAIVVVAALIPLAGVVAGIVGYNHGASQPTSDQERDKAFGKTDPAGGEACNYLDMFNGGIGTLDQATSRAANSSTAAIRDAGKAGDAAAMYDACVAAGANMSDRK